MIWRRKSNDYTGKWQELWPIGAKEKEKGADFLLRQTALLRLTSGEKCERSATFNVHNFSLGPSNTNDDAQIYIHAVWCQRV